MSVHFRSIVEDPWLQGHSFVLSRAELRTSRSRAPELPGNTLIYFFDGASRKNGDGRLASFGVVLRIDGVTIARLAVFLGDCTSSEAEYQGVLAVLRHALSLRCSRVCIYGDSKLVISQLNGTWKCKAENLGPLYEQGLGFVRRMHEVCGGGSFTLNHIYREFNADADSLANVALDQRTPASNVVVSDNWDATTVSLLT